MARKGEQIQFLTSDFSNGVWADLCLVEGMASNMKKCGWGEA